MRTIRTVDPQSGITTVKEITLISTAGATSTEYEELPAKDKQVANAANQISQAVYDVRKTMTENNLIQYQMMQDLNNNMQSMEKINSSQVSQSIENANYLGDKLLNIAEKNKSIDGSTVTINGETKTVNDAFTEILTLLNQINSRLG